MNASNFTSSCVNLPVLPPFAFITVVSCPISLFALLINSFFVFSLWRTKVFHVNVRILLISITLTFGGISITLVGQSAYNVVLIVTGHYLPIDQVTCYAWRVFFMLCTPMTCFSMVLLGVERWNATRTSQLRRESPKPSYLVIWSLIISWTIASSVPAFRSRGVTHASICYCDGIILSGGVKAVLPISISIVLLELICILLYTWLLVKNRDTYLQFGINRAATQSLAERFQTWQNVRIMQLMLAIMKVELAVKVITAALMVLVSSLYFDYDLQNAGINVLQLYYMSLMVEACVYPFICICNDKHVKKQVVQQARKLKCIWSFGATCVRGPTETPVNVIRSSATTFNYRMTPQQQTEIVRATWMKVINPSRNNKTMISTDVEKPRGFDDILTEDDGKALEMFTGRFSRFCSNTVELSIPSSLSHVEKNNM